MNEPKSNDILETLHLVSIPGMVESLKNAASEPLKECLPYDPEEKWQ